MDEITFKNNDRYLFLNPEYDDIPRGIQLLRVTVNAEETKFDFGYLLGSHVAKPNLFSISPDTYIKPKGRNLKLNLLDVTSSEGGYFSLHFQSLVGIPSAEVIDLVETDLNLPNRLNVYGIRLDKSAKKLKIY